MQKDKTSILIRAREYVRSLESKVAELEEKNRLLESRLARGDDSSDDGSRKDAADSGDEKVQVEITREAKDVRAAAAAGEPRDDLCTLKIAVSSPCNMTDVAVRTLQCLKEQIGDGVSLVAMSTPYRKHGVCHVLEPLPCASYRAHRKSGIRRVLHP